ncbi:MAG: ectoine synthase [Mesorhizobium sp.]|uniref:ectoine synthase n=1 Tax=Mesorhizobium sp. TaxID=1871066 RepID=UPI000FE8A63D|nr:ectoine synthase [Mesorhizobium sp.]RWD05696.1 MAG: ectoine synthase [Mesorhizobium sp.]RWD27969.1 MAG: ectoine synthase [Mesorhizobium sp.]TJW68649.1 MAG: ectoine synthase [Mesorhizobium sp.]
MFTRQLADVEKTDFFVDWGNGTSHRLLTQRDGMGFTVCHTVVAGSESRLQYRRHLEACYCISGSGEVEDMSGAIHRIEPGTIYVLDAHDDHYLRADGAGDMVLVSVFNPPLNGTERHSLSGEGGSAY